jgi:hypothetical protein
MVVLLSSWHCPPVTTALVHHNVAQNLEDIPVTYEFSDAFPQRLAR